MHDEPERIVPIPSTRWNARSCTRLGVLRWSHLYRELTLDALADTIKAIVQKVR